MIEFIEAPELCGTVMAALGAASADAGTGEPTALQLVSESELYPGTGPLTREQLDQETQEFLNSVLESPNADLIRPYSAIAALYRGEWQEKYSGKSEADAAFCAYLAAEKLKPLQIDMVLRTSDLYRGKWERADYRQRTLGLVISRKTKTLSAAPTTTSRLNDWLDQMNEQFAVVRIGSDAAVMDFKTPSTGLTGVLYKAGVLKFAAFRQLLAGEFVPGNDPDKPIKKADAWLNHPGRRQYQSMAYAPGENLPDNVLNLWRGFQVDPLDCPGCPGCPSYFSNSLRVISTSSTCQWCPLCDEVEKIPCHPVQLGQPVHFFKFRRIHMPPPLIFSSLRESINRLAVEAEEAARARIAPSGITSIVSDYEQRIQRWVSDMAPVQLARRYTIIEVMELAKLSGRYRVRGSQRYAGVALRRCGFASKRDWSSAGRNKRFWVFKGEQK